MASFKPFFRAIFEKFGSALPGGAETPAAALSAAEKRLGVRVPVALRALFGFLAVLACQSAALAQDSQPTQVESQLIGEWITRLTEKDAGTRADAAAALAKYGPKAKEAVPALAHALKDENPKVRGAAAEALYVTLGANSRHKSIIPVLIELLKDSDAKVCEGAVKALLCFRPDGKIIVPALIDALKHPNDGVRLKVINSFWTFSDNAGPAVPALIEVFKDRNAEHRGLTAWVLREIEPEKAKAAVPGLILLLKDKSGPVRVQAACTLGHLSAVAQGAVPALADALQDEEASVCASLALVKFGPAAAEMAAPALLETIRKHKVPYARLGAAAALVKFGAHKKEALTVLVSLMETEKNYVGANALGALAELGAAVKTADEVKVVVPALEKVLMNVDERENGHWYPPHTPKAFSRSEAAKALGEIGPAAEEAVPALLKAYLHDSFREVRSKAGAAIIKIDRNAGIKAGIISP